MTPIIRTCLTTTIAAVVVLGVAACGGDDPLEAQSAHSHEHAHAHEPIASIEPEDEAPEPAEPLPEGADGGASTPERAASTFALGFANWNWRDAATKHARLLVPLTAGTLREKVTTSAMNLREDTTAKRYRRSNRGVQLALDVQGSRPDVRDAWIVLRETARMERPKRRSHTHVMVYRMTVQRLHDGRWYVTELQLER